jgi:hypothetical protein
MSRLIDQLRASDFADRSARDLTLEYGEWLEQNKREDIFAANPDFAQEYHSLKDEIARARRPGYVEEFKGAFGAAVDDLSASGYALGALAAHGARAIGIPGADSARNKLLELMREQEEEAAEYRPSVGSYKDISSEHFLEDAARFATYGLGTVGPSILQAAGSGIAGAAAGAAVGSSATPGAGTAVGAVGGALLGLAEKKLAQKVLSKLIAQGVKNETLERVAKALPREAIEAEAKRLAMTMGSQAALAASSIGAETGSIYGDNPEAPGSAIVGGVAAGLLDVIPEAYILSRFFKPGEAIGEVAARGARAYAKRFATEAAKTIPLEGSTEAAQTLIEIAAGKYGRGEDAFSFTRDDYEHALNAGIIGTIGGAAMAPASAFANPAARQSTIPALTDRVVEGLPIPDSAAPGGRMEFGGEIPEADLTGIGSIRGPIRQEVDNAFRGDVQGFAPDEYDPLAAAGPARGRVTPTGAGINNLIQEAGGASGAIAGATPAPELPKSVTKAVEAAERAARAWEMSHASTPETGFGDEPVEARAFPQFGESQTPMIPELEALPASAEVTDAPLQNLLGRQVEYAGYKGELVRDNTGNFMVLPPARENAEPFWVEVAGTGKDGSMLASQARVVPLEPANMTPKPAPAVPIPGAPPAGRGPSQSKVPLGDLFPSDLVPRSDVNPFIPTPISPPRPPPGPVPTPTPTAPAVVSPASGVMPAGRIDQFETPGDEQVTELASGSKFSRRDIASRRRALRAMEANAERAAKSSPARAADFQRRAGLMRQRLAQMEANRGTGAQPTVGYNADNEPDLLSDIAEHVGRIRTRNPEGRTGGEVDDMVNALSRGVARRLNGGENGMGAAEALEIVNDLGPYKFESVSHLADAIEKATTARTKTRERVMTKQQGEQQADAFKDVVFDNKKRRGALSSPVKQTDTLKVGETFKAAREKLEVVDIDDTTGDVIVRDGPRFGTQRMPAGSAFYPDKGTLRRVKASEVPFLDEEEEARTPAPTVVLPIPPKRQAMPTGEQQVASGGNGVPPRPADSLPNVRRLRLFEQPAAPPPDELGVLPENAAAQPTVESQSVQENPAVALDKAVGKLGKSDSTAAVILIDNAIGQAYQRGAYRGAGNTLYVDMSSRRKGTATGQGSTVSAEADFLNGTEGRPALKLFSEKLPTGAPRYSIYGVAELTKPGGPRNWNMGMAAALNSNQPIQEAARRYWNEQAKRRVVQTSLPAASADLEVFPQAMAAWRRENPGEAAGEAMRERVQQFAAQKAKGFGLDEKKLDNWASELVLSIEEIARVEQKQAVLLSADYTTPTAGSIDLMRSALRALTEGRDVDVVAFEQELMGAVDSAAKTTGFVLDPDGRKKIMAFAVSSLNGPITADTILSVLHETGHIVTDGLAEPLRVAFHEAINNLHWSKARWLMNPRSLDIRLLANADPAQLSPEQRRALERLTPEEIAAARRFDRSVLVEEQMAEHLAQLGFDRAEARDLVQRALRFLKELWFRLAMAIQRQIKGPEHVSPELARRYVENRFLQFVHRDSAFARDKINDLATWLGFPATERQMIPVFPAGRDWDQRMQYIDVATGQLIPVDHAIYTVDAQTAYLKASLDSAARFVADNPAGGPDTSEIRLTRRAAFSAPLSFTPSIQSNTVFAAINLEEEIYKQISAHTDIGPFIPPADSFIDEWLKLPEQQSPAARRISAEAWAKENKDPTTGAPVAYNAETSVDDLPAVDEKITDREGRAATIVLSEAQDKALQQTIAALGHTQQRVQRRINYETDRIADLEKLKKRNPADFPTAAQEELDRLNESLPLRTKIAEQLTVQKNALLSKFQPGDLVNIYPTAEYMTVPSPDATEAQIRASKKGTVPRDLKFTDKTKFCGDIAAMDAWLRVPENRTKGQIYGIIAETYRKLNQIPTDLHRTATAGILRRAITGSFADELRASGLPALQALSKKFFEVARTINAHQADLRVAGAAWTEAFGKFAAALGERFDQSFKERVYDELMRVWNFIDVSERNRLGTDDDGDLFSRMEAALKTRTGIDVNSPAKRSALRSFLMATIENERQIRVVFENTPGLKVQDKEMGIYRRLISHGLVTGRRSVARHMSGLFQFMNPTWSATTPAAAGDPRTFWQAVADTFTGDRAAFDAKIAELFPANVVRDFVEPIVNNNTQVFDVQDSDGIIRKASLVRVRQAWADANNDVTQFAINLHRLEGGKPGEDARTVAAVMGSFNRIFGEIKSDQDSKQGMESGGMEILPRQMMDARVAQDWPAEWVSYATYSEADNLQLLHQLARSAAFGPDAIGANGELSSTIKQAHADLDGLHYRYDEDLRNGMSPREVKQKMGEADFAIAQNALKIKANLQRVETAFRTMSAATNYLAGDFKLLNDALGFTATMMVQNPRGTLINTSDILGSLVALKLSRPGLKAVAQSIHTLAAEFGNGVLQAFGQNSAFNIDAARRRQKTGTKDSDNYTNWRTKMANQGPGMSLSAPSGYESPLEKTKRVLTRFAVKGRDIIPNLGSPLQGSSEAQTLSPKLRWGGFPNWAMSTMHANIDAAYQVFVDLATRGVERINRMPAADRAQYVRELEMGVRDISAEEVGYFGGLILNDRAAFDSLKFALETKMAGEKSVGAFVAKAFRRQEEAAGAEWEPISNSQFTDIINYANTEWTLQNNFASMPPWMQSGPLRPLFIFLTWPYNAMRRFGKQFTTPEGKLIWWGANSTVWDGMKTFFLLAAPATIAGSFAIDWYDKYLLGKKQNLRDTSWTTALPGVGVFLDPAAFVERVGRYGSAGFATDILNQIVNYDTQRNLSLDSRIVAINALSSLVNSLVVTPIQQEGNITYASVARPFFQSIGGGGVLQYLQLLNNALGLNTQDAAINSRINTGNYLRAAGRELNLPVRVARGPGEAPTPTTPYLQQMELAALVNNQELFRQAYRNAIDAARDDNKDDPAKYVAENFTERHPLKRIFRVAPTEPEYRKLLATMDEYGATQVRAAVNSYNRYLTNFFGKNPYYGKKPKKDATSVEELIRSANRINSGPSSRMDSILAIP